MASKMRGAEPQLMRTRQSAQARRCRLSTASSCWFAQALNGLCLSSCREGSDERTTVAAMPSAASLAFKRLFGVTSESHGRRRQRQGARRWRQSCRPAPHSVRRVWSRCQWTRSGCGEIQPCRPGPRDGPVGPIARLTGWNNACVPWNCPALPHPGQRQAARPEELGGESLGAEGPGESAEATPCPVAIAAPIPRATANPPTRPTYAPQLVISALSCSSGKDYT